MTSLLAEVTSIGKEFGYSGDDLANFVKEQMNVERDERARTRAFEKDKLEKELELQRLKSEEGSRSSKGEAIALNSWECKLIPKFNESDVHKFFTQFEKVASQLEWEKVKWAIIVQSVFVGKAQVAYSLMNGEDSSDYDKVKEAVLNAYELIPEAYRQKFRSWTKRPFQSYVEFAMQKQAHFEEWLRAQKVSDFDSLKELILLEDFRNNLPRDLRVHIEEFGMDSLEDAAKVADMYVLSHKVSGKKGDNGVKSGEGNKGSPEDFKSRKGQSFVCYGCGEKGHIESKCPKASAANPTLLVQNRKVPSVSTKDLREIPGKERLRHLFGHFVFSGMVRSNPCSEGNEVTILRDSGSSQSCILESSLPVDFVCKRQEYVLLGGFPDTVSSWPLEEVFVAYGNFNGWVKFAVVKSFPVDGIDVILGNDLVLGEGGTAHDFSVFGDRAVTDRVEVRVKPVAPVTRSKAKENVNVEISDVDFTSMFLDEGESLIEREQESGREQTVTRGSSEVGKWDGSDLIEAQKEDPDLKKIYEQAESPGETKDLSKVSYLIDNGILYRVSRPLEASPDEDWLIIKQIMVPRKFRSFILSSAHENKFSGHFGIKKTCEKIKKYYFWPSLKRDVVKFCKTCHICQISGKPNQKIPKAPLYPIPATAEPFSQIILDIVGPLPKSKSGFEYLLTIMDRATRFPEVVPIRNIKSKVIIKHVVDFISRFGIPREIQTDRGTNFTSRFFEQKTQGAWYKACIVYTLPCRESGGS